MVGVPDDQAAIAVDAQVEHPGQKGRLGRVQDEPGHRQRERDRADHQQRRANPFAGERRLARGLSTCGLTGVAARACLARCVIRPSSLPRKTCRCQQRRHACAVSHSTRAGAENAFPQVRRSSGRRRTRALKTAIAHCGQITLGFVRIAERCAQASAMLRRARRSPGLPSSRSARSFSKSMAMAGSGLILPILRPARRPRRGPRDRRARAARTRGGRADVVALLDREAECDGIQVGGAELAVPRRGAVAAGGAGWPPGRPRGAGPPAAGPATLGNGAFGEISRVAARPQ